MIITNALIYNKNVVLLYSVDSSSKWSYYKSKFTHRFSKLDRLNINFFSSPESLGLCFKTLTPEWSHTRGSILLGDKYSARMEVTSTDKLWVANRMKKFYSIDLTLQLYFIATASLTVTVRAFMFVVMSLSGPVL